MGFIDNLSEGLFKKDSEGRFVYYPWGIWGDGFVVNSQEKLIQIQGYTNKFYIVVFPVILIAKFVIGIWSLLLLLIFFFWYYFTIKRLIGKLEKVTEAKKISEFYKNSSKKFSFLRLVGGEIFSLGFFAGGLRIILVKKKFFIGVCTCVLFGLMSLAFGRMLIYKISDKNKS